MIVQLGKTHEVSLRRLLQTEPTVNLFLLGFLDSHGLGAATWIGVMGREVEACALVIPGRLVVPFAPDAGDAFRIGQHFRGRYRPCMLVGPREASDALWDGWTQGEVSPRRCYDQRLYAIDTPTLCEPVDGFRRAVADDWPTVSRFSGEMEAEDLGRDPRDDEPGLHDRVIRDRIDRGSTWVIERDGDLVFQLNVGTSNRHGCQVGGTYVPPDHRGKGIATQGMFAMVRHLLTEYPRVTLHVNEANIPAVRAYERVGFQSHSPFRLITL